MKPKRSRGRPVNTPPSGWMTREQARIYVGAPHIIGFVRLARLYGIPTKKIGGIWTYKISDIEAMVKAELRK